MRTKIGYWVLPTILLLSTVRCDGGIEMTFSRNRHNGYDPLPYFQCNNGQFVEDDECTQIVTNGLAIHSGAMHNLMGNSGKLPSLNGSYTDVDFVIQPGLNQEILSIPLDKVYSGAGRRIRIWVKAYRADGASSAFLSAYVGRDLIKTYIDGAASTHEWYLLEVPVEPVRSPFLSSEAQLTLMCGVDWDYGEGNEETITVRTVSINEGFRIGAIDRYKDTSGANNKIGDPDYPFSAGMQRTLVGNLQADYLQRMPRSNIFQHCWRDAREGIGSSYSANEDDFGEWVIRKSFGVTQLDGIDMTWELMDTDDIDVKVGLWSFDSVHYDNITYTFSDGMWVNGLSSKARGLIVKNEDLGTNGYLSLAYVTGTFQNNELLSADSPYDGYAFVDGTNLGPRQLDYDEQTRTSPSDQPWGEWSFTSLTDHETEYILRLDVKISSGSAANVAINTLMFVAESLNTDIDTVLPNALNTEQDDDVRGSTWRRLNNLLNEIYNRRRQIVLQDFNPYISGIYIGGSEYRVSMKSDYHYVLEDRASNLGYMVNGGAYGGVLFPSKHSRRLRARVWVQKTPSDSFKRLYIASATGTWPALGANITGSTSGATGELLDSSSAGGSDRIYSMRDIAGEFQPGESITWTGGSGTASGGLYGFEAGGKIHLAIYRTNTPDLIAEHEIDIGKIERTREARLDLSVDISPELWADMDVDATDGNPYMWTVNAYVDDIADFIQFKKIQVFEEPLPPGGWEITRESE